MGTIRSGTGIISGIDTAGLVNSLMLLARLPVVRLQNRVAQFQRTDTALKSLEANLLTLATSAQNMALEKNFSTFTHTNSDSGQLKVNTRSTVSPGAYQLQSVRLTATHQALSQGFVNADQQSIGTGTLLISYGGQLSAPTTLDVLNSGAGVRRGTVRVTDRSGSFADIDLSAAYTVQDVLQAINENETISLTASTLGGKIVVTDTTGSTSANLSIVDLNGGHAAEDLGIDQSVAAATFTGSEIFTLTGNFTLDQINDGNGLRRARAGGDFSITTGPGVEFNVDLSGLLTKDTRIQRL
ncbi:MAG: hypothetical protein IID45_10825, partial [Planctomycetes bacterium]|nr:hypothetical protein [Planctomycetota bacterium]